MKPPPVSDLSEIRKERLVEAIIGSKIVHYREHRSDEEVREARAARRLSDLQHLSDEYGRLAVSMFLIQSEETGLEGPELRASLTKRVAEMACQFDLWLNL